VPDAGLLESVTVKTDKPSWRINEHDTSSVTHRWSPVMVAGSTLYAIVTTTTSNTGISTTKLIAIAAATGHVLWSQSGLYGPLAVAGGRVFAATNGPAIGTNVYDENLVALNAATGANEWSYTLPELQYAAGLAVSGSTLLAAVSGQSAEAGGVFAFAASGGTLLWQSADSDGDAVASASELLVDGSVVLYASSNNHLIALQISDGRTLWRASATYGGNTFHMVGGDGVAYVHDNKNRNAAYRISNGTLLWHSKQSYTTPILLAYGRLLVATSSVGAVTDVIEAFGKR
jgi:outer membrane protein assembly factor BamB